MRDVQLPLFDLPEPAAGTHADDTAWPVSLLALVECGVPGEVCELLMERLGGRVVCVPRTVDPKTELVAALGVEAARHIVAAFPAGGRLTVPRGVAWRRRLRDRALRRDSDRGAPVAELVRRYELTERQVWTILGRGE